MRCKDRPERQIQVSNDTGELTMNDKFSEAWLRHLGLTPYKFPREICPPWRKQVRNANEYLKSIKRNVDRANVYTSVYSNKQLRNEEIDKIYVDIDNPNLKLARKDMRRFVKRLDNIGCEPRVYFTGGKGFAVYIDIKPAPLRPNDIRAFVEAIAKPAKVDGKKQKAYIHSIDWATIGDLRRVSRPPYTINFNTLKHGKKPRMCLPVDYNWSMDEILAFADKPKYRPIEFVQWTFPEEEISEPTESPETASEPYENISEGYIASINEDLGTVVAMASDIVDGRHRIIHYIIVPGLIAMGHNNTYVVNFVKAWIIDTGKQWRTYEHHTRASIRRTRKNAWLPWTLETLLTRNPEIIEQMEVKDNE